MVLLLVSDNDYLMSEKDDLLEPEGGRKAHFVTGFFPFCSFTDKEVRKMGETVFTFKTQKWEKLI